jgi:hypothetical protein
MTSSYCCRPARQLGARRRVPIRNWIAIGLLFGIGALTVLLLGPYYNLRSASTHRSCWTSTWEAPQPASLSEMYRGLALRIKADSARNGRVVRRMREAFQLASVLLLLQILAWFLSIARVPDLGRESWAYTGKVTPVRRSDSSQRRRCTPASWERALDRTRFGWPRISQ